MSKKTALLGTAYIACSLLFLSPRLSHAYGYNTCNSTPVKWSGQFQMFRDRCSMPDNSDADWGYWNAGWNWWQITNEIDWNWWYDAGCTITFGNDRNETALVDRSQISGFNGLTTCRNDGCTFFWETEHLTECDTKLANDMAYSAEDESFWNWSNAQQGRVVIVHEWGHALGLNHSEGFDVMRAVTPYPVAAGNTSEPYPDDANGARFLYGGASTNVFASAQMFSGSIQATNFAGTINVCRGQAISLTYSVVNNGSTNVNGGFRIYINNSPSPGTGWNMFNGSASSGAGGYFTETRTLNVPFVSPGIYWILWQVDAANAVSEWNEGDNTVHSAMTLNVLNC
jgi:hypothetical protein